MDGNWVESLPESLKSLQFGNPLWHYLAAVAATVALYAVFAFLRARLNAFSRRHANAAVQSLARIHDLSLLVLALWISLSFIQLPPRGEHAAQAIFMAGVVVQLVTIAGHLASLLIAQALLRRSQGSPSARNAAKNLGTIVKVGLWTLGLLFVLSNLGLNVASLLTGLGIGGIAIALATQSVLGDSFSSFVLFFDRPFGVGETIQFDGVTGTVEEIGLRTTRVRTYSGELLILGNSELTKARITKGETTFRRAILRFGVKYETPAQLLRGVPEMLRETAAQIPQLSCERAHLIGLGDFSVNFETVIRIELRDGGSHLDRVQEYLYRSLEELERRNISLAYPTQTIELNQILKP